MSLRAAAAAALEALEDGAPDLAAHLLLAAVEAGEAADAGRRRRCGECTFIGWPGQLEAHVLREHSWRREAA